LVLGLVRFSFFPYAGKRKDAETHAFCLACSAKTVPRRCPVWPPKGLRGLDAMKLPLLNTLILLCSGTTVAGRTMR
jgi:heme/copper-type cytochrome/quinol oxidase subunit 3